MSKRSWQASLSRTIKGRRVAVVGMGHELRGDDAAGIAVARALHASLPDDERALAIDAGPVPENQTGPLRRFWPDIVLFVDAAEMDEPPGAIRWLPWNEADGLGASTHTLSLQILARFLIRELGCKVALLGIQPVDNAIASRLSPEMAEAIDAIVQHLLRVLS
jgi:hydrogenase 3 maturation protease